MFPAAGVIAEGLAGALVVGAVGKAPKILITGRTQTPLWAV